MLDKSLKRSLVWLFFLSIFTVATKGNSNCTYTFFGANMEVKIKFKGFLSKVQDQKANLIVVKKPLAIDTAKVKSFAPLGFTIYWGEISDNQDKKCHLREAAKKKNYWRLLANPYIYNIRDLSTKLNLERFRIGQC